MLASKTVFVVGAGASNEVGLPVGNDLRSVISRKLHFELSTFGGAEGPGDRAILRALQNHLGPKYGQALDGAKRIRSGLVLSGSIDDFVDAHRHDPHIAICGKLAIASSILEAERKSKLYFERRRVDDSINFSAIENTWYVGFYRLLAQQVAKNDLGSLFKNVSIITFNYDRCIEHFLTHALALNYHLSVGEALALVQQLPIYRPYGSVGNYFGQDSVEFGAEPALNVERVSNTLRTYTERIEDKSGLKRIRASIDEAKVLVFLGFAFHDNNMRVLGEENLYSPSKRIFATRYGISESDLSVVEKKLAKLCGLGGGEFNYLSGQHRCADLFHQFQLTMRQ